VDPTGDGKTFPPGIRSSIGHRCYLVIELARKKYEPIVFRDDPSMGLGKIRLLGLMAFAARPEMCVV
jgi:hypothetical protein